MNASMMQSAAPALVLLGLMVLVAWLLQRYRRHLLPGVASQAGPTMKVMGSLALGPQQRVVTVQLGEGEERLCLVLGVSAGNITALHQMPLPASVPPDIATTRPQAGATGFKARLAQLTQNVSQGPHATR